MLKYLLSLLFIISNVLYLSAHYSIHSSTQGVIVESNGKTEPASKGKELKANDYIIVPDGGEVEIYNDLDKNIYKSLNSGKISVTRLMIEAKKTASDNSKNVASRLRLKKNSSSEIEGEKIYVEKGMVRRSLAVFDPEAENLQVDSKSLGRMIARYLSKKDSTGYRDVAVDVSKGAVDSTGVYFRIVNTLDFPVYFNVLKFDDTPENGNRKVEISKLGQPDGSYVLLPGQAITRESFTSIPADESHLLVVTHFRYDLDEVVDETGNALSGNMTNMEEQPSFPLFIMNL